MEVSKSVEYHLKSLLCTVVEEVDLPQQITDIIISQFLRVDARKSAQQSSKTRKADVQDKKQGNLLLKDYPPAYNLAKSICTTCQEKMTSQVTQYFNSIIIDAGAFSQGRDNDSRRISGMEDSEDEEEGFADLRKAHRLLRELWRAAPDILINVIPQIEAELSTDSARLRQLATETLGDLAAGIGIAGLPTPLQLDPASFPLPSISSPEPNPVSTNPLLTPASGKPFPSIHRTAYQNLLTRRNDKATGVRLSWVGAASRILLTLAGGIGLSDDELLELLSGLAQMLRDREDRVRLAAIKSLHLFGYHGVINILGADGGLSNSGTVFSTLAERFRDKNHGVREEAIISGARIWGVASRDIEEGAENVTTVIGDLPNRLFDAYYTNDLHIHSMIYQATHELLLPLGFPSIKPAAPQSSTQRRRTKDADDGAQNSSSDPDVVRVHRILTLVRSLSQKSRQVFFAMQARQPQLCQGITVFLKACEAYNGGVVDDPKDEDRVKKQLTSYIEALTKQFPDPSKMSADLWKFAEMHNRRDYQLIRFAMGPENDYRTVQKAVKELNKRIKEGLSNSQSLLDSLNALLYRCAQVVYNRSHVPAIMHASRTDKHGLASAAHEVLREISSRNPDVLKTSINALCKELEETAPSATKFEEAIAADSLKACAHFARRYPGEVSKDRKFLTALSNFALFSKSPRAAKHAVSILLTVADRKEMHARDILTNALENCEPGSPNRLSRLSAISQICLLVPSAANSSNEAILKVTVASTLQKNLSPSHIENENAWDDAVDDEMQAKELALRALVNRVRAESDKDDLESFEKIAEPVMSLLMRLVSHDGEMTPTQDTPAAQRNRLRFLAAKLTLKLCASKRRCEELITPQAFISIALIIINPPNAVRIRLTSQLKKYLNQNKISHRWLTTLFLLAFEPDEELRSSTHAWLRSKVQVFERQQQYAQARGDKRSRENVIESLFARLLSLMIHHPDYPDNESDTFDIDLLEFSRYIMFYLSAVATEDNISLIFHIAQRVKATRDNISKSEENEQISERLYVLSDLAQAVIKHYADMMPGHNRNVNLLQTFPGTITLPKSLFGPLPSHDISQKIAEKNYLPEETAVGLEASMKDYLRSLRGKAPTKRQTYSKKRKAASIEPDSCDEEGPAAVKKQRKRVTSLPVRKTPKVKKTLSSPVAKSSIKPSRKSSRASHSINYVEAESEDDEQMQDVQQEKRPQGRFIASAATSSPITKRKAPPSSPAVNGDDSEHSDHGANGIHVHEDDDDDDENVVVRGAEGSDDGEDEEEEEDASEREGTPSPLKERKNATPTPPATSSNRKTRGATKKKVSPKKAKAKPTAAATASGKGTPKAKAKGKQQLNFQSSPADAGSTGVRVTRATRSAKP